MSSESVGTFNVRRLFDLQELDGEIATCEKALDETRARLADDSALVEARRLLAQIGEDLKMPAAARREAELAVQGFEEKLATIDQKLYGGAITNPRELEAYGDERGLVQKQRGAVEDKLLTLMVEVEDLESARVSAQDSLERLEREREAELVDLTETENRLQGELEELRRDREGVAPRIPPAALSVYEGLRQSLNGYAVAKVERAMCQGCRLTLSTLELQRSRSSQGIVRCSSCRRILYVV